MKYKALMLDYDGTVAPAQHQIQKPTQKVVQTIKKAQQKLSVCLVTARTVTALDPIIKLLGLKDYIVLLSGAQIIEAKTLKTVWQQPLDKKDFSFLVELGRKHKLQIYSANHITEFDITNKKTFPSNLYDIWFPVVPETLLETIETQASSRPNISHYRVQNSKKSSVGVAFNHIKATKHQAILRLAKLLKIKPEQMIGVGDSYNDFPLLAACGLKVAMGNALKDLKAIADYVAPPVEKDGLVKVIEKFVL